jgi:hypothetical protein
MNTPDKNMDDFLANIITSYETRIQKIQTAFQSSESLIESSHFLFENVHSSLIDLKTERDLLNSKLSESLAKNESLRKKDYNSMMSSIICALDSKGREAESRFSIFIEDQKETAQSLKNSLLGIKDITSPDVIEKITVIKEKLPQILKQQEVKKGIVMKAFIDYQQMHNRLIECLENLLKRGDRILIQDIKNVKNEIVKEII